MSSILHTNGVLTGLFDYLCLCCETHFALEDDAILHISDTDHLYKLQCNGYLETFIDHRIRKFQMGYHCQFCNKIFSTLSHVNIHVASNNHIQTKGRQLMKREKNATCITFMNSLIEKCSWDGIIDNTCIICEKDIESPEHVSEKQHMVNLIQKEIYFDGSENVFRKIDTKTIQCLTCNQLVDMQTSSTHIEQLDHIKRLFMNTPNDQKKQNTCDITENTDVQIILSRNGVSSDLPSDAKTEAYEPLNSQVGSVKEENNHFNIDNSKTKKTILESDTIDSNIKYKFKLEQKRNKMTEASSINNEVKKNDGSNHKKIESDSDSMEKSKTEVDRQKYAKENHLVIENAHAICRICQTSVSSAMKCLEEHVSGAKHQHLKNSKQNNNLFNKLATCKYLITNPICTDTHVYLDEHFSISLLSFHTTTPLLGPALRLKRCQLCEKNLLTFELKDHWQTNAHRNRLRFVPVITNFTNEFIREVRPGIFHCGFCNSLEISYNALQNHMKSLEHEIQKAIADSRLRLSIPYLRRMAHQV